MRNTNGGLEALEPFAVQGGLNDTLKEFPAVVQDDFCSGAAFEVRNDARGVCEWQRVRRRGRCVPVLRRYGEPGLGETLPDGEGARVKVAIAVGEGDNDVAGGVEPGFGDSGVRGGGGGGGGGVGEVEDRGE